MALQPVHCVHPVAAATTAATTEENAEEEDEYEFGIGGWKPAKNFTPAKHRKVKVVYAKCKLVWDTIAGMVRA
eukprot:13523113-Ditylum_brightwellii.AAC.1